MHIRKIPSDGSCVRVRMRVCVRLEAAERGQKAWLGRRCSAGAAAAWV